jgi:hypothetical protein
VIHFDKGLSNLDNTLSKIQHKMQHGKPKTPYLCGFNGIFARGSTPLYSTPETLEKWGFSKLRVAFV